MKYYIKKNAELIVLTLILVIFVYLCSAYAMMVGMSTRSLSNESDLVIKGTVIRVVSQWTEDRKSIFSTAMVQVDEVIAGSCDRDTVEVVYDGGVVDGIGMKVSDSPSFEKGEIVILFLSPDLQLRKAQAFRVYGRAQGKYRVDEDNIARKRGFSVAAGADRVENDLPVDELIRKIKAYRNED